jgi:hypothetical protein
MAIVARRMITRVLMASPLPRAIAGPIARRSIREPACIEAIAHGADDR